LPVFPARLIVPIAHSPTMPKATQKEPDPL
jgi:hypothetical protein